MMISAVFLGVEGVASHYGADENGGGLLEKCLADRQFTVVFSPL